MNMRLSREQLLDVARWLYHDLGLSIVPCGPEKRPIVEWEEYQTRRPTWGQVYAWYRKFVNSPNFAGWFICCGEASNMLLVLDFEHWDAYTWFLQQLPDDLRQVLENTLTVLTGVRSDGKRGVHVYLRIYRECDVKLQSRTKIELPVDIREGDKQLNRVELTWTGAGVVAPGTCHRSGVLYQVLVGPESTPHYVRAEGFRTVKFPETGIKVLSCDEANRLLSILFAIRQSRQLQHAREIVWKRELTDDQICKIVEIFKKHDIYVEGHRNNIHFYLQGWLLKLRYVPDSVKELSRRLAETFNDEELERRVKLVDYQVKWLLEGRKVLDRDEAEKLGIPHVLKGKSGLIEEIISILRERGFSESEAQAKALAIVHEIAQVVSPSEAKKLMIVVSLFGRLSGQNKITYIANDPVRGIALVHKILPSESRIEKCIREKCREAEDEKTCRREAEKKCVEELTGWGYDKLLPDWHIVKVRSIYDVLTQQEVYYVVFRRCRTNIRKVYPWVTKEELLTRVKRELGWAISRETLDSALTLILREHCRKVKRDYAVIGIVPDPDTGKVKLSYIGEKGEAFRRFIEEEHLPSPEESARRFIEFVEKWYSPHVGKTLQVVALGLFQVLNFVRTVHNRRSAILVLHGAARTGKSTLVRYVIGEMFGGPEIVEVHSASVFETSARIARVVTSMTLPVIVDDVGDFSERSTIVETLKNIVTLGIAREYARPYHRTLEKLPAVSGMVITCNEFKPPSDPGLQDRIVDVSFTVSEQKSRHAEFNRELGEIRPYLRSLGRAYLKFIVDKWDEIKEIVLQDNYVRAGLELFRIFMEKLGIVIDYGCIEVKLVSEEVTMDDLDKLRLEIYRLLERHASQILLRKRTLEESDSTLYDALYEVLKANLAAPYGIRYMETDGKIFIAADFIRKTLGTTVKDIVEKFRRVGIDAEEARTSKSRGLKIELGQFISWLLRRGEDIES